MSDTPKRCFHCGSGEWAIYRVRDGDYQVACRECGCRGPVSHIEDHSVEGWNSVIRPKKFFDEE